MNRQWISARGASLSGFLNHGKLWVVDHLPVVGTRQIEAWEAHAEQGDTMHRLFGKWAQGHIFEMPRTVYGREAKFMETLQRMPPQLALVVHDAHLLKGSVLDTMRLLAEAGALVVLVGDVSKIDVLTRSHPGFCQRAGFCVVVTDLFEAA